MSDTAIPIPLWSGETLPVVNVASVPQRSPFRYPGGKTWLIPQIRQWLASLPAKPARLIEPFAGGAIVGLTAAFEQLAESVILVERDEQVAAVWKTIISTEGGAEWLASRIVGFELTPESVRGLLASRKRLIRERAFQTLVQNRISRGGILAPGAGIVKQGENGKGLLSRWYPETLRKRILDIGAIRGRIRFVLDHEELFRLAGAIRGDFLMTYDDAEEVRALAVRHRFETRLVAMNSTHHATMYELLIGRNLDWIA